LKAEPRQVEVYLNDGLEKKTDLFFGSALIKNLLPQNYNIEVKKEGYLSWKKNLEVKEKEVTEIKSVFLAPSQVRFNLLINNVQKAWFSPDGKKIAIKEASQGNGWSLKLYDLEKNLKSHLIKERDVSSKGAELLGIEWDNDSKKIYLNAGAKEQEKRFFLELEKPSPVLKETNLPRPLQGILAAESHDNNNYYLDNLGFVLRNGTSSEAKINKTPFPVRAETEYRLRTFDNFVFLQESGSLYLFNKENDSWEKFLEKTNDVKLSPDKKKLAIFSDSEIWIFFLKNTDEQPLKKSGEKTFLTRLSEKIGDVFWLNPDYLVFNSGDKIKIAEIDDRDKINVVDLVEYKNSLIFWRENANALAVLSEGNLYQSESFFK